MTKLKRLLNGNMNIRAEEAGNSELNDDGVYDSERLFFNLVETTAEEIEGLKTDHNVEARLQAVINTMDEIISTCRKYRLTHLWPWTQRGKERKADVIKVQKEAEKRRKAAYKKLNEFGQENTEQVLKVGPSTVTEKATTGYRRVLNYGKTFLWGMTVRNAINTAGMTIASPFWLLVSGAKSLKRYFIDGGSETKWKWYGAFTLPHPHLPGTWYTHYTNKSLIGVEKNEYKRLEKEIKKYPEGSKQYNEIYNEMQYLSKPTYGAKTSRWHAFFSGSTVFDNFGYTPDLNNIALDYNGIQKI
jgi:hypothetical protein